jgi:hypothetical protein
MALRNPDVRDQNKNRGKNKKNNSAQKKGAAIYLPLLFLKDRPGHEVIQKIG